MYLDFKRPAQNRRKWSVALNQSEAVTNEIHTHTYTLVFKHVTYRSRESINTR